ncbi:F-box/FBD/LRR-repeat protein At1g13570 isoform X2 [Helianthus annuus]|nr:F-box/FBD/LRR-repeat protein At1g13570 isoform X2 [Helianthus annuus]
MELSHFAPQDFISHMPDHVITNILDLLPLQDAVRTSILSKSWRFKWTMLSQLIFDVDFFEYLSKTQGENNHVRIISRILHQLRGSITKFFLDGGMLDANHINRWILFLSRKGIKDLTLINWGPTPLNLPTHLFFCVELKHLKLSNCYFNPPPTFHGFPNLLSLELCVDFEENIQLSEFFARCALLENLTIDNLFEHVKVVQVTEIAKIENLKILSLELCDLDNMSITSSGTIFELVGSLPKLQELHLGFHYCTLREGGAKKTCPTVFPCLKALKLSCICLDNGMKLSCAFELIRSFPNLQILEIARELDDISTSAICSPEVDYNTTTLLHLRSVMFECLKGSENELCLIKYLLACSPFLKKIVIRCSFIGSDEKFMFAKKLLMLHRASPVAEIDLFRF